MYSRKLAMLLFEEGWNVDFQSDDGTTTLHVASAEGGVSIVEILIQGIALLKTMPWQTAPMQLEVHHSPTSSMLTLITGKGSGMVQYYRGTAALPQY